jgi:hypothetical protein
VSAGIPLGFALRGALLHVRDLAVAERDHHSIALRRHSADTWPVRRTDDFVFTDLSERHLVDCPTAPLQDLTGLAWSASRRRVPPQKEAAPYAAPLGGLGEQRGERSGIPMTQRLGC